MPTPPISLLALMAAATLAIGCSGEPTLEEAGVDGESFGLVAVQFAHDLNGSSGLDPARLEVNTTAQFVRYAAIERERVARLLALPLHPDIDLPALESCQIFDQATVLSEKETDGEDDGYVDLLEAGELSVETGSEHRMLEPRYFPGLLPFISGVIYGEAQLGRAENPGPVVAQTAGSEVVGAFRATGISPEPLVLLEPPSTDQPLPSADDPTLRWDGKLTLRWQTASAPAAQDATYFELFDSRHAGERVLRCAVRDDGSFSIHAEQLSEIIAPDSRQIVVQGGRIRQIHFAARGLDSGELRLSTTGRTTLQLR